MFYIPLTATPVGWLVLGLGGYALYKSGKKKGEEEAAAAQITAVPAPVEVHEESAEPEGEQ
nr:hypothetical protein [uncultured Desulfobulbus sp.]